MAVYVDAADALPVLDADALLSAVRSEVDAKVRHSMPTSIEAGAAPDDDGPARAAFRRVGPDEAALRKGRATTVRSKDMIVTCTPRRIDDQVVNGNGRRLGRKASGRGHCSSQKNQNHSSKASHKFGAEGPSLNFFRFVRYAKLTMQ